MCFETKSYLRRENERLKDRRGLDKWLIDSYKDFVKETQERNLELLKENINLEKELQESDKLLVEKIIENKKLKDEINNMKPKRSFNVGQLVEFQDKVYEVLNVLEYGVVIVGLSTSVKGVVIVIAHDTQELIEL